MSPQKQQARSAAPRPDSRIDAAESSTFPLTTNTELIKAACPAPFYTCHRLWPASTFAPHYPWPCPNGLSSRLCGAAQSAWPTHQQHHRALISAAMDHRDISLSQTLGGLRIANPDDADSPPPSSHHVQSQLPTQDDAATDTTPASSQSPLQWAGEEGGSLGFDPSSYSTESFTAEELSQVPSQVISHTPSNNSQPAYSPVTASSAQIPQQSSSPVTRQPSRTTSQRRPNRTSAVPAAYQSHPQAAAAAYAAMNSRPYNSNGRPTSTAYLGGPGGPIGSQKDTYRLHKEPSQVSLGAPRRIKSTSRKPVMEAQAGVPDLETSHTERNYASRPPVYNGATVPRSTLR